MEQTWGMIKHDIQDKRKGNMKFQQFQATVGI